ncbi:MAG: hypothetical protein NXI31_25230 [bacterium]|nr:hypothetical protein [bacterium]
MTYDPVRGAAVLFGGNDGIKRADTWEWNGVSWLQIATPGPSGRAYHSMAFDTARNRVLLFGGATASGLVGDTWEWDGATWTQVATSGPGGRCGPIMTFDTQRGRAILFGGQGSGPAFGDTWEWDGAAWSQVHTGGTGAPSPRFYGGMAYDQGRGRTVMFAGQNAANVFFDDTWEWDGSSWTLATSTGPSPRASIAMVYDASRSVCLSHGGRDSLGRDLDETWEWNGSSWSLALSVGPGPRRAHAATYDSTRRRPIVFGGYGSAAFNDTWELSLGPNAPVTMALTPTAGGPPGTVDHAMTALPGGGALLFGGDTGTPYPVLTFELRGATWTKKFSTNNPMVRRAHALALDRTRQNNVLFGGVNPAGLTLSDTWTWADDSWTLHRPTVAPAARSRHRMTLDRNRDEVVLFGGESANGNALGDFWSWDGTSWSNVPAPALPPPRFAHGLAFDEFRGQLVLFGGRDGGQTLGDLWEWDGIQWLPIVPNPAPSGSWTPGPRSDFAMSYDPNAERVVVHGGLAGACLGDLWTWNGTSWTYHEPGPTSLSTRHGHTLVFERSSNRHLIYGGTCNSQTNAELWEAGLPVFWRWSPYGSGCIGSQGTPQLTVKNGSSAIIGQTLQLEISNVPTFGPFASAFGVLGINRSLFLGQPIPFDLGFFQLPGCLAWTSSDFSFAASLPVNGISTWDFPLANTGLLLGFELNLQGICFESPAYSRWASVSNAAIVRVGSR